MIQSAAHHAGGGLEVHRGAVVAVQNRRAQGHGAAARRVDRYQHGVHFVPLVGVPAPDLLAPAVAESLQFQVDNAHSAISARDQLIDFLRERATLLGGQLSIESSSITGTRLTAELPVHR